MVTKLLNAKDRTMHKKAILKTFCAKSQFSAVALALKKTIVELGEILLLPQGKLATVTRFEC